MNYSTPHNLMLSLLLLLSSVSIGQARNCSEVSECVEFLKDGKQCPILRVPKKSFIQPVPFGEYRLTQLRSGVWMYNDGTYLTLLLRKGTHLVMIDFPDSDNSNKPNGSKTRLTDAAEEVLEGVIPSKVDLVYSHAHFDHIAAVSLVRKYMRKMYPSAKVLVWGTEEARQLVEDSVTKRALIPDHFVGKSGRTISIGKELSLEMRILGGHTQNDLLLYIPRFKKEAAVAMYVDTIFPGWSPPFDLGLSQSIGRYIAAHEYVLKLDFDFLVPGHLVPAKRRDVVRSLRFVKDLISAAKVALEKLPGKPLSVMGIQKVSNPSAPEFGNLWYAFITQTREAQIDICEQIIIEKWGCRLAGLDITARGNCFAALTYRIEEI